MPRKKKCVDRCKKDGVNCVQVIKWKEIQRLLYLRSRKIETKVISVLGPYFIFIRISIIQWCLKQFVSFQRMTS